MEKEECVVVVVVVVCKCVCMCACMQEGLCSLQSFRDSGCFHCQYLLGVFYSSYCWKAKKGEERDRGVAV